MLTDLVLRTIQRYQVFSPGERVVVAVSGGPDSLALLSVLRKLLPRVPLQLTAAHLDHAWREGSEKDAAFVRETAERWGFPCIIERLEPGTAKTEDAARRERYRFLRKAAKQLDASAIALGHTRDDQVETLLLHLLRGSGSRGLAAMRRRNGDLARPLLDVTREQIELYLKDHQLKPLRDPSNEDLRYSRNRIRREVLPALERFEPQVRRLLARTADLLAEEDSFLESEIDGLHVSSIDRLPVALQRRLIRKLNPEMSFEQEEAIRVQALETKHEASNSGHSDADQDHSVAVKAEPCDCDPATFSAKDSVGHVDADAIKPPLIVSHRQPGDRIQPLGFGHPKKLQDVLVDAHVPRQLRGRLPIVRDQQGIVWVPGVTLDERFRVTEKTGRQLHLEIIRP